MEPASKSNHWNMSWKQQTIEVGDERIGELYQK